MPPNINTKNGEVLPDDVPTIDGYTGWVKVETTWDFYYESETDRELMPDEITAQWVAENKETHNVIFYCSWYE